MFIKKHFKQLSQEFYQNFAPVLADMHLLKMTDSITEELTLKPIRSVFNDLFICYFI